MKKKTKSQKLKELKNFYAGPVVRPIKIKRPEQKIEELRKLLAEKTKEADCFYKEIQELKAITEAPESFYTKDMYYAFSSEIYNSNLSGLSKGIFIRFLRAAKVGKFLEDPPK